MRIPFAYSELRPEDFPFTLEALDSESGAVVWKKIIETPGPLYIPALAAKIGRPVKVRITWPSGKVTEQ